MFGVDKRLKKIRKSLVIRPKAKVHTLFEWVLEERNDILLVSMGGEEFFFYADMLH